MSQNDNHPESRSNFDPQYGRCVQIAPNIERIVAPNASGFTFTGTNSYIVSAGDDAIIIDPGPPEDKAPNHLDFLLASLGARKLTSIILTHTHLDHCGIVADLLAKTGAPLIGFGPHILARPLKEGEINPLEGANNTDLVFDKCLKHEEVLELNGLSLKAIHTPGHAQNHICLALVGTPYLFSGDHIMGWSTSVIAPPEGSMSYFMMGLDRLASLPHSVYFPGHGGRIPHAHQTIRATKNHKLMREKSIKNQIDQGITDVLEITKQVYSHTDEAKIWAASLNVAAHIEYLIEKGEVPASILNA